MKTYADIKAEITKLEKQAELTLKQEIAGVVGRIKEAIKVYGLTAEDLGFGKSPKSKLSRGPTKARKVSPAAAEFGIAKYRDPETGKTWTGRGRPPDWILAAKDREAFAITPRGDNGGLSSKKASAKKGLRRRAGVANGATQNKSGASAKGARSVRKMVSVPAVKIESGAASE